MIANYGYKDGAGDFYISIDTDKCANCEKKGCTKGCPQGIFEIIVDDWDDEVAAVVADQRKKLKYSCSECKPASNRKELPCQLACTAGAIAHSW